LPDYLKSPLANTSGLFDCSLDTSNVRRHFAESLLFGKIDGGAGYSIAPFD
jgi:hypothetical protein